MNAYSIAFGRTSEHAVELSIGLSQMVPGFAAHICGVCDGRGEYPQTYTVGCERGYYTATGVCEYCDGTGLCQGDGSPAPESVREQVLVAGRAAIAKATGAA